MSFIKGPLSGGRVLLLLSGRMEGRPVGALKPHHDRLVVQFTTKRTGRAWLYREQLRYIGFASYCAARPRRRISTMRRAST
jgi:hypothetical protein